MKIPKNVMKAVAVGIVISGTSACSLIELPDNTEIKKQEVVECPQNNSETGPYDCPACGMG